MRALAAIDYNRKCDIIEGKIQERISSLDELFSDNEFQTIIPIATYDIFQSRDFLSGSMFSINELEEIWNIYMSIITFCSLKEKEAPLLKEGKTRLFCKRKFFDYVLDYEQEIITFNEESIYRDRLFLSLYKNDN